MLVFGTRLVAVNYVGIGLVVFGFVVLNVLKFIELRQASHTTPVVEQSSLTIEMFESSDRTFSQPRDD